MPASRKKGEASRRPGSLATYKKKRNFTVTPEPSGAVAKTGPRLRFVVQKHRASRLHYDFRLEADGVLASWAVPKGPTLVPGERRLAMHVEDHPMDYRDFEGIIPKGQYGAGEVIVWDNGTYRLAEGDDPAHEIASGKIKFVMSGKKLRGTFTLVRMHPREGESGDPWLLLKDHDGDDPAQWNADDYPESVKTGRTLQDVAADPKAKTWQSKSKKAPEKQIARGAARAQPVPDVSGVELATLIDAPFDDPQWLFEIKWDGYRAIATVDARRRLTVVSRNGTDLLKQFPDLEGLADAFSSVPIVVDGEIVSLDDAGRSDFQRLQGVGRERHAVTFAAFDVLYADGRDQRKEPLEKRKALLERLIADDELVMYSKHVVGDGIALFRKAQQQRLEGIIGKRRDSLYIARRTREWVKIKAQLEQEFVVGGYTEPRGSRKGFGSLLLGAYEGKALRYVGHVGTGFSAKRIDEMMKKLKPLERAASPFANAVASNTKAHWVKPVLVAQVRFAEWTRDGILRQPAFLGLRIDKDAKSVVLERAEHLRQ